MTGKSAHKIEGLEAPALATAFGEPEVCSQLLEMIQQACPEGRIVLCATAGVRQLLLDRQSCQQQLQLFRDKLGARFAGRAELCVLTGEQEAAAEWQSVQQQQLGLGVDGMVSGGGASCQLFVDG